MKKLFTLLYPVEAVLGALANWRTVNKQNEFRSTFMFRRFHKIAWAMYSRRTALQVG